MTRNQAKVKKKKKENQETFPRSQEIELFGGYSKNTQPFLPQLPVQPLLYYILAKYFYIILVILRLNYVKSIP